tara:strand:+ start:577 stop:825 length:249 start_codon:yes stop_codon:yes gene_type:complete
MKTKIRYSKQRNELQFYDKSIAIKAFKKGLDVYATKGLNTSSSVSDYSLNNIDAIMNMEEALFIIPICINDISQFELFLERD